MRSSAYRTARLERGKHQRQRRLRPGEAQVQVDIVVNTLMEHVGRWHKIHKAHCRPDYLYRFNKGKGRLDERITLRNVSQVLQGESDYYYGMVLNGGVVNEPKRD